MDNLLKNTIRDEVNIVLDERNKPGTSGRSESTRMGTVNGGVNVKRKERSAGRLSNLLEKIRSRGSNGKERVKQRKVQIKYMSYDPLCSCDRIVKQSEGGGPRFINITCGADVRFCEIKKKAIELYFDQNEHNLFNEKAADCLITLSTVSNNPLDDDEDIWHYLAKIYHPRIDFSLTFRRRGVGVKTKRQLTLC